MFTTKRLLPRPLFQMAGLSIRGFGIREKMLPSLIERPEGTGDYLFMMFHDPVQIGSGEAWWAFPPGTLMWWDRGAAHFYGNPSERWSHSWIHCDGKDVKKALKAARIGLNRPWQAADPARIERQLFQVHDELSGAFEPDAVIVRHAVINLIREARREAGQRQRPQATEELARAKELLDNHYDEALSLSFLAQTAGLSTSHFCVEFRKCFGMPPVAYLAEKRMRVAATLLTGTNERVGEIGQKVGYPDPYYFSKRFKAFHGVPPSALRRRE